MSDHLLGQPLFGTAIRVDPTGPVPSQPLAQPGDELAIGFDPDEGVMTVVTPSGAEHVWRLRGRFPYSLADALEDFIRRNYPARNPLTVMRAVTLRWDSLQSYQQTDCLATRSVLRRAAEGL